MCQVMECTGRCVSVSEPMSLNTVARKYRKFGDSPEMHQLARDVMRWECRPYPTIQPPPLAYFIKIDSPSATALPLFRQRHLFSLTCLLKCTTHTYPFNSLLPRTTRWRWWRGTVVERRSLAGELSLSCARPAADG